MKKRAKILVIDIETSPNLAYVWGAWKQNVGANQWVQKTDIMSYAAKWLGEDEVFYNDNRTGDDRIIVAEMFKLLDEADMIVAHNGQRFDMPRILGRGLVHGFKPPSPYKVLDTLLVARREFAFMSNTLAALCEELGLPLKSDHKKFVGFALWSECLKGNVEAWKEMKEYNIRDIVVLEALYLRLRPYMRHHPNVVYQQEVDGRPQCAKCGSDHIQFRGWATTPIGTLYRRFQCMDCDGYGRVRWSERGVIKPDGRNAV